MSIVERAAEFVAHEHGKVNCLKIGKATGRYFASGGEDRLVKIWEVDELVNLATLTSGEGPVDSICMDDNSEEFVATGCRNGCVTLWNLSQGKVDWKCRLHRDRVTSVQFHPQDKWLIVSGSADSVVKIWDSRQRSCFASFKGNTSEVKCACFSFDENYVMAGYANGELTVWDVRRRDVILNMPKQRKGISSVTFHPTDNLFACSSYDGTVWIWNSETFDAVEKIGPEKSPVKCVQFDQSGERLYTASAAGMTSYGWQPLVINDSVTVPWKHVTDMAVQKEGEKIVVCTRDHSHAGMWLINSKNLATVGTRAAEDEYVEKAISTPIELSRHPSMKDQDIDESVPLWGLDFNQAKGSNHVTEIKSERGNSILVGHIDVLRFPDRMVEKEECPGGRMTKDSANEFWRQPIRRKEMKNDVEIKSTGSVERNWKKAASDGKGSSQVSFDYLKMISRRSAPAPSGISDSDSDLDDDSKATECNSEVRSNATDAVIDKVYSLMNGEIFADKYLLTLEGIKGKPLVLFALHKHSLERVVLKFYTSRALFENSKKLNSMMSPMHVCKLLDVIDLPGYPPCLVFERGDVTLDEWIEKARPSLMMRKAVLFEVLNCLAHVHSQNVIHCDLKPSNIIFFFDTHRWKLLDFDNAVVKGTPAEINYTPMYASPEIALAEEQGESEVMLSQAADMWSFGIIAFEVISGDRFYGKMSSDDVKDCLRGRRPFPSLDVIDEKQANRLISNLISIQPEKRWSAIRAMTNATFKSADDTVQRAAGIDKLFQKLDKVQETQAEVLKLTKKTLNEAATANAMVTILAEEFRTKKDAHLDISERKFREAVTMVDAFLSDDPIYMLNVGGDYRLRIGLYHKVAFDEFLKIRGVRVKPPDAPSIRLEVKDTEPGANWHETFVHLKLDELGSQKMSKESPWFGLPVEKYVPLEICIDVAAGDQPDNILKLKGQITCCMVKKGAKMLERRFVRSAHDKWKEMPQWMRERANGTLLLAEIGAQAAFRIVTTMAFPHSPGNAWFLLSTFRRIFTLNCGCTGSRY